MVGKFSFEKRGISLRKSVGGNCSGDVCGEAQQSSEDFYVFHNTYVSACKESTPKCAIRDDLYSELSGSLQKANFLVLDFGREGRKFDLDNGNGVYGVCATKGICADFREADVPNLSRPEVGR